MKVIQRFGMHNMWSLKKNAAYGQQSALSYVYDIKPKIEECITRIKKKLFLKVVTIFEFQTKTLWFLGSVLVNWPTVHSGRVKKGGSVAVAVGINGKWHMTQDKWRIYYVYRYMFGGVLILLSAHIKRLNVTCMK